MYKRFLKFRNAYWYLKEAERIADSFTEFNNEEILCVSSKTCIALANLSFEAGR